MCSVLPFRHYDARKHLTAASCFTASGLQRETPEGLGTAGRLRCSGLVTLLVLSALVLLTGGAMAQTQETSRPILSSALPDGIPFRTQGTEKLEEPSSTQTPFDAAALPPIESIGTGSNIRPFLASGVPPDLTRAALRRAWSTDPAIRYFVGLSENFSDLNAAGAP